MAIFVMSVWKNSISPEVHNFAFEIQVFGFVSEGTEG